MTGMWMMAALLAVQTPGAGAAGAPTWQQGVEYRIEARLDEAAEQLVGRARVHYRNNSPDTLDHFWLHLHLNAFRPNSLWARTDLEAGITTFQELGPAEHAFERITAMEVDGRVVHLIYPHAPDSTVVGFALPEPLPPGGSIQVDYGWDARPSTVPRRQGRSGRQYDFAQWYPRVVVYDARGWRTHPLYRAGEFHGEFARYDVTLELRSDQVMGATGVAVSGDPGWEAAAAPGTGPVAYDREWYGSLTNPPCIERSGERICDEFPAVTLPAERPLGLLEPGATAPEGWKRVRWVADRVHHFAWSTSPDYIYEQGAWDDVTIHVLYRPGDEESWGNGIAVRRTATALQWLDSIFGDYPYPQVTNLHRLEGGGTEFPMLVMNGSASQGLILHEVGHIYAHGVLANTEWYEGWLDEGLTSFQTAWFNERAGVGAAAFRGSVEATVRRDLDGTSEPVVLAGEEYTDYARYSAAIYTKGSVVFWMLRALAGEETFTRILRTYHDRYRFRHVDTPAFQAVAEEVMGQDLGWFFGGWLHTTGLVDYALTGVTVVERPGGGYRTDFAVEKRGDLRMPPEVEFRGADGEHARVRVAGAAARGRHTIETDFRPVEAVLDPEGTILDWNPANNGWAEGWGADPLRVVRRDRPLHPLPPDRSRVPVGWFPLAWGNGAGGVVGGLQLRRSVMGVHDLRVQLGLPALPLGSLGDGVDAFDPGSLLVEWTRRGVGRLAGERLDLFAFLGEGRGLARMRHSRSTHPAERPAAGAVRTLSWGATASWVYEPGYVAGSAWTPGRKYAGEASLGLAHRSLDGGLALEGLFGVGADTGNHRWLRLALHGAWHRELAPGWTLENSVFLGGVLAPDPRREVSGWRGSDAPRERHFFLSSADPWETTPIPWLRSAGAVFDDEGWTPGGGTLRGYHPRIPVPWLATLGVTVRAPQQTVGGVEWQPLAAAGVGTSGAAANGALPSGEVLASTAVGVEVGLPGSGWRLRLDVPFWVRHPSVATPGGDDPLGFRVQVGFLQR